MKLVRILLTSCALVFALMFSKPAYADYTASYVVEQAGSSSTSVANSYFTQPATIAIAGQQYRVTMTISTADSLGAYPVKILNIAGQQPIVSKWATGGRHYYAFSFTTANLVNRMNGSMQVDINSINYHHTYGFGVVMNAGSVPAIASSSVSRQTSTITSTSAVQNTKTSTATTEATASSKSASRSVTKSSSQVQGTSKAVAKQKSSATKKITKTKIAKQTVKKTTKSRASSQKKSATGKQTIAHKKNTSQQTKQQKKSKIAASIGISVVAIGAIGGGIWWYKHHV